MKSTKTLTTEDSDQVVFLGGVEELTGHDANGKPDDGGQISDHKLKMT